MESYASTRMRPVNHSPTRAARRAVIHRVESEYERFDCISDMHKFGVKVQQFMWTETSAEITAWYSYRCGRLFFCSVQVFQTSPNARASFAKQNSASAMMLTSRLRVEVWRCSNANHADTLVPHGNWRKRSTRPELRRFFAVSLLSGWHNLWSWFTHVFQQIPDPVKRKIWLSHRHFMVRHRICLTINKIVYHQHLLVSFEELLSLRLSDHFALVVGCINNNWFNRHFLPHARSRFELHEVWGTW